MNALFLAFLVAIVAVAMVVAAHDLYVVNRTPIWRLRVRLARAFKALSWYRVAFMIAPISGGGISSFVPEVWAAALLTSLKKAQVFAQLCNRDYEGEIAQAGDTVHITSISRPTIASYLANSTVITPEVLTAADRTLVIDQAKYFAFEVDDVDARQARGNVLDEAMREAAYGLSDAADTFLAGLAATTAGSQVASANQIADVAVTTGDGAYTQIAQLGRKLDEANVARKGRFVVIPPWYLALLLDTNKIAYQMAVPELAGAAAIEGYVNRLLGFDVFVSNNVPGGAGYGDGDDWFVIAGTKDAWSYAEQISKTEAYRPQSSFADAVKGLHLYGGKLVRPDGLATLQCSQA